MKTKEYDDEDTNDIEKFVKEVLEHDGVFIFRMLNLQFGNVATSLMISNLFDRYKKCYEYEMKSNHEMKSNKPRSFFLIHNQ